MKPKSAASNAETMPAPISQEEASAQNADPPRTKAISVSKAPTRKAIGKGTSIGWIGWPPMLAVDLGNS